MRRVIKYPLYTMTFSLLLFLMLTLLIPYLCFLFTGTDFSKEKPHPVIIAHRGASGTAPENTLASFSKAVEIGADIVELDVHLTSDDSLVVMHDYHVKRTTNGTGHINDLTFSEIRRLDAGSWFDTRFAAEKVPTLAEVLQLVNGRAKVLIELKWPAKGLYANLVDKVVQTVRAHNATSWVIIQSFETTYLEQLHQLAPDFIQQQLIFGSSGIIPFYFDRAPKLGTFKPLAYATSVNVFYMYAGKGFIRKMHEMNKTVYAFTPNSESDMRKLIHVGIDGIITNYPEKVIKLLGR